MSLYIHYAADNIDNGAFFWQKKTVHDFNINLGSGLSMQLFYQDLVGFVFAVLRFDVNCIQVKVVYVTDMVRFLKLCTHIVVC